MPALLAVLGIIWLCLPVELELQANSQRSFSIDTDFGRFRAILVRKNATAAIVNHSGMELVEEQLQSLAVDGSNDDRPLLNALLSESKTDLSAHRKLTVKLNSADMGAQQLELEQASEIHADQMRVDTQSLAPAGILRDYHNVLSAKAEGQATQVDLAVDLSVRVTVPWVLRSVAQTRVERAAELAGEEQQAAISALIKKYDDRLLVLPEAGD